MSIVDPQLKPELTKNPPDQAALMFILSRPREGFFRSPGANATVTLNIPSTSTGEIYLLPKGIVPPAEYPTYSDRDNWLRGRVKPLTCKETIRSSYEDILLRSGAVWIDPYTKAENFVLNRFTDFKQVKAIYTGRYLSELLVYIVLSVEDYEEELMAELFKTESKLRLEIEEVPFSFDYLLQRLLKGRDAIPRSSKLIYEC